MSLLKNTHTSRAVRRPKLAREVVEGKRSFGNYWLDLSCFMCSRSAFA